MDETDLLDFQWHVTQRTLPDTRRQYALCLTVNALLYLTKRADQWRLLPRVFAYSRCYYYFRRWQATGR
ncbi:transposase [Hymenobacter sp. BT664]|uniref:Transposase n=1 Tax=Hymenobacter montanus TaxID=2771359 RepID=A0A927BD15_9BACT|nr:transposase [Hymenobacter montanus]